MRRRFPTRVGVPWAAGFRSRFAATWPDPDAAVWIAGVEAADGEPLEPQVKTAMMKLVRRAKQRGVWDPDAQLTIAAGARTLDGALVPLLGSPLINFNFVSGDRTRKGGCKGDGATKYFIGIPLNSVAEINNVIAFTYATSPLTFISQYAFFGNATEAGSMHLTYGFQGQYLSVRCLSNNYIGGAPANMTIGANEYGFFGAGRDNNASVTVVSPTNVFSVNLASDGISSAKFDYFRRGTGGIQCPDRLSVFGLSKYKDLTIWRSIITQYHADLNSAIP